MEQVNIVSLFRRLMFVIELLIKSLIPPFYSFAKIERLCKKKLKSHPEAYLPRLFLGSLYSDYQKYSEARNEYEALLKQDYRNETVLGALGEICYRLADFSAAVKYLEEIETRRMNDKYLNYYIGASLMSLDQTEKALPYLLRAKELSSKKTKLIEFPEEYRFSKSNLCAALGYCLLRTGRFAESAKFYREAISLNPTGSNALQMKNDAATAHIHLANGLLEQSQTKQAVEQFHLALELEPEDSIVDAITRTLNQLGEEVPVLKSHLH